MKWWQPSLFGNPSHVLCSTKMGRSVRTLVFTPTPLLHLTHLHIQATQILKTKAEMFVSPRLLWILPVQDVNSIAGCWVLWTDALPSVSGVVLCTGCVKCMCEYLPMELQGWFLLSCSALCSNFSRTVWTSEALQLMYVMDTGGVKWCVIWSIENKKILDLDCRVAAYQWWGEELPELIIQLHEKSCNPLPCPIAFCWGQQQLSCWLKGVLDQVLVNAVVSSTLCFYGQCHLQLWQPLCSLNHGIIE